MHWLEAKTCILGIIILVDRHCLFNMKPLKLKTDNFHFGIGNSFNYRRILLFLYQKSTTNCNPTYVVHSGPNCMWFVINFFVKQISFEEPFG